MKEVLLTSSVLILVLAALRRIMRGRISLRLQYALWLLVAVRLLVPVQLGHSPISVLNLTGGAERPAVQTVQPGVPDPEEASAAPALPWAGVPALPPETVPGSAVWVSGTVPAAASAAASAVPASAA